MMGGDRASDCSEVGVVVVVVGSLSEFFFVGFEKWRTDSNDS